MTVVTDVPLFSMLAAVFGDDVAHEVSSDTIAKYAATRCA
jgi:hypothetical protein